ncbi:MAG: transcriptional regulator [Nitrospirae bacterium]|nr:transcriptional regulator [Nitrospirota bacterium]
MLLLKKNSSMSIDDLSKLIDITPMGIRQHLLALEKKGIVTYVAQKRGIGRPGFIYQLTESSAELFPNSYDKFALGVLRDIKKHEGQEMIDKIFEWRRERLFKFQQTALTDKENIDDTLQALKDLLEAEGHIVELSRNNGHYHLKQFHCPINKVSAEFKDACRHELQLYRDLIGKEVTREHTISDGSPSCLYKIPRA